MSPTIIQGTPTRSAERSLLDIVLIINTNNVNAINRNNNHIRKKKKKQNDNI